MAQFFENFNNGTLGQPYAGFTTKISRSGDTVTLSNDFAKGNFLNVFKGGTTGTLAVAWDVLNNAQDVEQLIKFRFGGAIPTAGRYGILYNRYEGTTEATTKGYAASFTPASSVPSIIVYEDSLGTVNYTNYAWENNKMYWARFRTVGNQQQFKIWPDGADEPTGWRLDSTYTGPSIASPYSGIGNYYNWSNLQIFQISAGTNGDIAPSYNPAVPTSTPLGVYGGGYGAPMGYGGAYGNGVVPAFTVEHLDYTANAFIDKKRMLAYASNALIVYLKNSTYIANAFIDRQNSLNSTSNAFIEWKQSLDSSSNARIERIESTSYNSNAEIESYYFTSSISHTANARIEKKGTISYASNAFIENKRNIAHVSNAFVEWQKNQSYQSNAFVEYQKTLDYTANALIDYRSAVDYDSNAFIEWQLVSPYTSSAFVEWVKSQVYTSNARIERAGEQIEYDSNARIQRTEQISYTANARLSNPVPDKRPQNWEDSETRQPQDWTADDKTPATWNESEEKQPAEWTDSQNSQPQQWSESDNKKPADWSPIYYD